MYEFEKHPKLTEFIQEMANTGKAPQEWTSFIETLNQALRIHDVSGQLPNNLILYRTVNMENYNNISPFKVWWIFLHRESESPLISFAVGG